MTRLKRLFTYTRHPELVCALHAFGSRVHFASKPFGPRGTMDAETSCALHAFGSSMT